MSRDVAESTSPLTSEEQAAKVLKTGLIMIIIIGLLVVGIIVLIMVLAGCCPCKRKRAKQIIIEIGG